MKSTDAIAGTLDNANQPRGRNLHANCHAPFSLWAYAPLERPTGGTMRHHRRVSADNSSGEGTLGLSHCAAHDLGGRQDVADQSHGLACERDVFVPVAGQDRGNYFWAEFASSGVKFVG